MRNLDGAQSDPADSMDGDCSSPDALSPMWNFSQAVCRIKIIEKRKEKKEELSLTLTSKTSLHFDIILRWNINENESSKFREPAVATPFKSTKCHECVYHQTCEHCSLYHNVFMQRKAFCVRIITLILLGSYEKASCFWVSDQRTSGF